MIKKRLWTHNRTKIKRSKVAEVCPDCNGTGLSCGCVACKELGHCVGCDGKRYV
jgi:hypothetical protein